MCDQVNLEYLAAFVYEDRTAKVLGRTQIHWWARNFIDDD